MLERKYLITNSVKKIYIYIFKYILPMNNAFLLTIQICLELVGTCCLSLDVLQNACYKNLF